MATQAAGIQTLERMMTHVAASSDGLNVAFADGLVSLVPWGEIEGVGGCSDVDSVELRDPYEALISTQDGRVTEIPWDFARHFGDAEQRERDAEAAVRGQRTFARRLRTLRCGCGLSQQELAALSGVDEADIERFESAVQPPTLGVIRKLAAAMGRPFQGLLLDERAESRDQETD